MAKVIDLYFDDVPVSKLKIMITIDSAQTLFRFFLTLSVSGEQCFLKVLAFGFKKLGLKKNNYF